MRFRSVEVAESFDLNNVCQGDGFLFVRDGVGHAGRGTYAFGASHDVLSRLSSATQSEQHSRDEVPISFGLVPFLSSQPDLFFIPTVLFSKTSSGEQLLTLVGDSEDDLTDEVVDQVIRDAVNTQPPRPSGNSFQVSPRTPIGRYLDAVLAARQSVRNGILHKAVIARDIEVLASEPIDVHSVLLRLRSSFGSSYRYCIHNMIGASPELLVEVDQRTVRSHPLAGTAPRTGDPQTDAALATALMHSTKDQIEHRVVIDMVRDTLLPYCSFLDWEADPSIVTVANVQHLGTSIEGALTEPPVDVMTLVKALTPTPALGGFPSQQAIEFIQAHEMMERGFYGGAVGWCNARGQGTFAVTIRCAELTDDRRIARLFAGGGIVAESDPYSELAETQAKFQAMLSAIVRP
ncbi:MAG: isochorismate synthase [Actinobacteria bacterium]|uniref:isochorismate synthase n=1 Tax=freshwater metagenome TaxID=449393 RepID=A0A6J6E790_9ZZZZ|nr:isochorismate synthase [Actinomycetota bacterium]